MEDIILLKVSSLVMNARSALADGHISLLRPQTPSTLH